MSVPSPILAYSLASPTMLSLLPAGYTPLVYIESSGTLWIDSGIALNSSTSIYRFECKVGASTRDGHSHSFFGTSSYLTGMMGIYHYHTNNYYSQYIQGSSKGTTNFVVAKGDIIEYYLLMNMSAKTYASKIAYNNEVTGSFAAMSNTTDTIRVFKSDDFAGGYWKCYYFRIIKDNVPAVDLRPARRDSDGVIGMYDLVSRTFKTNSGSGSFIAGPELAVGKGGGKSLPEEYLLVEYLESNGTQCINTNYAYDSTNTTYRVLCRFLMTSVTYAYLAVYGAYGSEPQNTFRLIRGNSDTSFLITTNGRAGGNNSSLSVNSIFDEFTIDHQYSLFSIKDLTTNNSYSNTSPAQGGGTDCTSTFYLFSLSSSSCLAAERIHYFKLFTGTTIVRHMIPCYRKSDMKPGMYDTVNGVFYTNSGSGEFVLGPSVTTAYTWESNAGSYGGENILGTRTNARGKRCDELTSVAAGSSGITDCASWNNITDVYRGDTFTVSFDIKADIAMTAHCFFYNNTSGVVQVASGKNHNSGATTTSSDGSITVAVTTSWQRFTITWTMGTSGTQCLKSLIIGRVSGSSTNNGKTIYVKNVKVQRGKSTNATFDSYPGSFTNLSTTYDSRFGWVASGNDSSASYIEFDKAVMNSLMTAKTFSIVMWVRIHNTNRHIFLGDGSASYPLNIEYGNGKLRSYFSGNPDIHGSHTISANTWYHIALCVNSSGFKQYVNGEVDNNYTSAPSFTQATANYRIGSDSRTTQIYMGADISNFMIFDTALTEAQVKELYGK